MKNDLIVCLAIGLISACVSDCRGCRPEKPMPFICGRCSSPKPPTKKPCVECYYRYCDDRVYKR